MDEKASLKSITSARLEIIPRERRNQALALMARAAKPIPRAVNPSARPLIGDADSNDIVLGLYIQEGATRPQRLCGVAQVRERYPTVTASGVAAARLDERAFLIDAVTLGDEMVDWRPSVRALLIACAASLIATTAHDRGYRTYVACRVTENDDDLRSAVRDIGGRALTAPPGVDLGRFCFNDVPSEELRFLDESAAANAAAILMSHLSATTSFSMERQLPRQRLVEALLSIDFSRPIRALIEEIAMLAHGRIGVGWHMPRIISNDAGFPLRIANG